MITYFTYVFIGIVTLDTLLKLYLNRRQQQSITHNYTKVPEHFQQVISLVEHQKAANYSLAKLKTNNLEILFACLILLGFTLGGGIQFIINMTNLTEHLLSSQVLFVLSFMIISSIINLPFDIYKTFQIEQKFGFNKITPRLFIQDQIKSIVLTLAIGTPILYLIAWIMTNLTQNWWLYVWGVVVGFNLLALLIYPTIIAPLFNKFSPLEDLELKEKIMLLLNKCGFKSQGVFVMDGSKRSSHGNAYFTGLGNSKRIVFFDTLLKQLNHDEVIAVLAHELGHFKHKHILKQMFASFGLMLLTLYVFSLLINFNDFYAALNVQTINSLTGLLLLFLVTGVITLPLAPVFSFMSRKNEYEADNFAKLNSNKDDLISGLVNMYRDNASTLTPDSLYVKFYYSHPPANLRIANLEK